MVKRGYVVGNTRDNMKALGNIKYGNMVILGNMVKKYGNTRLRHCDALQSLPSPILRQMQIMSCERKGSNISFEGVLLGQRTNCSPKRGQE